jgi:hypothetical protein
LYRNADTACNALASTANLTEDINGGSSNGGSSNGGSSNGGSSSSSGGNPGNDMAVGNAGEDPNESGNFGDGVKGQSQ